MKLHKGKGIKLKINLARKERRRRTRKAPKYYLKKTLRITHKHKKK